MNANTNIPTGFISVDEAVDLINSDTRKDPVVDMDYLVAHLNWIETGGNVRIPKIRALGKDEIYKTKRGKLVQFEHTGDVYVQVLTAFDRELLRKTIRDKYAELTHKEYKEITTRAKSTVADDAEGKEAVRPRANKPIAKEGASIGSGEVMTSNGDGLQV